MKQIFLSSLIFSIITNVARIVADITIKILNARTLENASYFIDSFESSVVVMFFIALIGGLLGMAVVAALRASSSTAKISRIQESIVYAALTYATIIGIESFLMGFGNPHIYTLISESFCVIVSYYISYIFLSKKHIYR